MRLALTTTPAPAYDSVNQRMVSGLIISLVVHAMLLALQFGEPGLGMLRLRPPQVMKIIQLTPPKPDKPQEPVPLPLEPEAAAPAPQLAPAAPHQGMTVVRPQKKARPQVRKAPSPQKKAMLAPRKSTPLPGLQESEVTTRVITQDANKDSKFNVPLPQPTEAEKKVIDKLEAQEGSDAHSADAAGAAKAEAERLAQLSAAKQQEELAAAKLAEQSKAKRLAEAQEQERLQAAKLQEQIKVRDAAAAARQEELAQRKAAEEQTALKLAEAQKVQKQAEELAAKKQAEELAAKKLVEEQAARKLAQEQVAKKQSEELALRKQAEELAARKQAEELAARKLVEEAASRKLAEQRAQQQAEAKAIVDAAARQQAQEVARQQAQEAARREAQDAAARQLAQEAARQQAQSGPGPGSGGGTGTGNVARPVVPGDLASRLRDAVKGLDVLKGNPPPPQPDPDRSRRRVVAGRIERDIPIRMYAESWRQKIERNGALNYSQYSREKARNDPLVSVAIRSDGSVEDVLIVHSSGRADLDEAVKRIVRVNARYSAFPPAIAAKYDVIEIRRIWRFDETLTLVEEAQ